MGAAMYTSKGWRLEHSPVREFDDGELVEALEQGFLSRVLFEAEVSRRSWGRALDHSENVSGRHFPFQDQPAIRR